MFRNTRYFGKNEGKHNFYGELEYIQDWDESQSEENDETSQDKSRGEEDTP